MSKSFEGKRVLVTGGANGLGKAIVKKFYEAKATVIALDKDEAGLAKLKQEFPTITTIQVDLVDWNKSKLAVEKILPIHHLVNNAGILRQPTSFLESSVEDIDLHFNVNFKSAFNMSQVFANGVIAHKLEGGTIVNVSSIGDRTWTPGVTTYCCTKAALTMLSKCMSGELGKYNIRANTVRPGAMETDLAKEALGSVYQEFAVSVAAAMERLVLKTKLETDHVADLVLFLSSPAAAMITGQDIALDGGLSFT